MSLQVGDERIEIRVYYTEKKNKYNVKKIKVIKEEDYKKKTPEEKKNIKILTTAWKVLDFKTTQQINKIATKIYPDGTVDFDVYELEILRVQKALIEWDMITDNGMPVILNDNSINTTHPEIMRELSDRYREAIYEDTEEEKKD